MVDARLNKTTYKSGDVIQIQLDFGQNVSLLDGVSNYNIDIFKVDVERNNLAFSFSGTPIPIGGFVFIRKELPDTFREGLYMVSGIRLIRDENLEKVAPISVEDRTKLFFWFSEQGVSLSELELTEKINELNHQRGSYSNATTVTSAASIRTKQKKYRVLVYGVGCLLHSTQPMQGYTLHPLKRGFDYNHMLDAVNSYSDPELGIRHIAVEKIQEAFGSSTPLFVIDFHNVIAVDHSDAGQHCSKLSEDIFTVLAYEKGQRPNSFASVIVDQETNQSWHAFHFPGYRGNLVSDFNPSSTSHVLARLLPKIKTSPWVDLIMRIYADAVSEANLFYACFKCWSILELIAKNKVVDDSIHLLHPNASPVRDNNGNHVTTKNARGKVYFHLISSNIPPLISCNGSKKVIYETYQDATNDPNFDASTQVVTLWDFVSALYEIRNATAHSGEFNLSKARHGTLREQLAAQLWELESPQFFLHVKGLTQTIVSREL